ncbi:hypothetical protein P389DRAFT_95335 [Cystobasidium minutum MCA 4210]|uniref:uncharacterized protein n=1 Tax=Cystobasidium minutum MCA 4210 TaxID=1397322 RepID=UPI0034D016BD|eukprot:jgi/Rhomi1/95335/CE95334_3476
MVKLVSAFGILSALALATASPVKRQDSTAATSTAADTAASTAGDTAASSATDSAASTASEPASSTAESAASSTAAGDPTATAGAAETTVTAFVPSSGGVPNATLYAVTGANETYLAGIEYVTVTDSAGATSTAAIGDVFVVSEDELDLYIFDPEGNPIEITECEIGEGGTTATCNGVVIDIAEQAAAVFQNLTITGQSSGVPAYLPTGTADPVGVSFASNAPALVSSVQAAGGASATELVAGTQTITSQTSTSPSILPGASGDSAAGSIASSGTVAEASTTDASAASTDAAATDTAPTSADTAAASTEAVPTTA